MHDANDDKNDNQDDRRDYPYDKDDVQRTNYSTFSFLKTFLMTNMIIRRVGDLNSRVKTAQANITLIQVGDQEIMIIMIIMMVVTMIMMIMIVLH